VCNKDVKDADLSGEFDAMSMHALRASVLGEGGMRLPAPWMRGEHGLPNSEQTTAQAQATAEGAQIRNEVNAKDGLLLCETEEFAKAWEGQQMEKGTKTNTQMTRLLRRHIFVK
jgi:hypothetical protein